MNPRDIFSETFDAVLFDMDGTLISSVGAVLRSWSTAAQEFGVSAEAFGDFHGTPARQVIDKIMPEADAATKNAMFERVLHLELHDVDGIEVLPGAHAALATLTAVPGRAAIVTSCTGDLAAVRIGASQVPAPEVVVTFDQVTQGKPHPEPFERGAAGLGRDPRRCLVVEDATAGLTAGRAAGCATLALTTTTPHDDVAPLADAVVADLSAVRFELSPAGIRVVSVE